MGLCVNNWSCYIEHGTYASYLHGVRFVFTASISLTESPRRGLGIVRTQDRRIHLETMHMSGQAIIGRNGRSIKEDCYKKDCFVWGNVEYFSSLQRKTVGKKRQADNPIMTYSGGRWKFSATFPMLVTLRAVITLICSR